LSYVDDLGFEKFRSTVFIDLMRIVNGTISSFHVKPRRRLREHEGNKLLSRLRGQRGVMRGKSGFVFQIFLSWCEDNYVISGKTRHLGTIKRKFWLGYWVADIERWHSHNLSHQSLLSDSELPTV